MLSSLLAGATIIVAVLLVLAVVVQNSKGGGLNSAFGASSISAMIGNRKVAEGIEKITWYLGGALLGLCLLSTILMSRPTSVVGSKMSNLPAANSATSAPSMAPSDKPVEPGK